MKKSDYMINKAYKKYLIPMIVSSVSPNLCASIDKAIVGNMLGQEALAAVGLVMPITVLVSVLSLLFSMGGSNMCTIFNSKAQEKDTNHTFSVAMSATFISVFLLAVAGLIFLSPLVRVLGADTVLFENTRSYTRILLLGLPMMTLCMAMDFFLRVDGSPNVVVQGMVIANVTNIILDVVLIKAGMGVAGAALATAIGYTLSLVWYLIYYFSKRCTLHFSFEAGKYFSTAKTAVVGGLSAVIQFTGWLISIIIINKRLSEIGGAMSLAVYAVVLSISIFTASSFNGVINAMTPVVGTFYGDRDYPNLRTALKRGTVIAYCFGVVMALLYLLIPSTLSSLFGVSDAVTLQESCTALRIVSIGIFFQIAVGILSSFYQVTEKPVTASIISFTRAGVLQPFLPLVLTLIMGVRGVYFSLVLMEVGGLLAACVGVALYKRKNSEAKGFLLLEPVGEGCEFQYTLKNNIEDISSAVEETLNFCHTNGLDAKRSSIICLALEEMTRNIIEHGMANEKKIHYIDIRVKMDDERILLRIRDDGMLFNPTQAEIAKPAKEALEAGERLHLGLRMVNGIAKKIEYTRVLGFNNTVIYA